ncbi:MAG: hypothetical protein IIA45_03010 [Bacteroidetes bacterium]|nr:hypothetical protein [Bacteroidota bacterium]
MIYKAFPSLTELLVSKPETGMGYQVFDAVRKGRYTKVRFIVYNSELIIELNDNLDRYKLKILNEGYTKIFSQSEFINLEHPTLVMRNELSNLRLFSEGKMEDKGRHKGGTGAVDNDEIYSNGEDIFVRLSVYENDRRIDFINKKLIPGSYATTEDDYLTCKSFNDDPVDRYALPNDEEIEWAFYVQPKSHDKYHPGIVQPANGHNGGGVEALFDNGTSDHTYFKKTTY